MTLYRSVSVSHFGALAVWSGLCLGIGTLGPGCSPSAPTLAGGPATPARLKAMQEKGRAAIEGKTTTVPSRRSPPTSNRR
jgi:hypothetical protein